MQNSGYTIFMVKLKRAYEKPEKRDGVRILVDRVWPRGVSKEELRLDRWEKSIAPSSALRTWFAHKAERWAEFRKRYKSELKSHRDEIAELRKLARGKTVTLVFGAKDEAHNQAVVLKEVLEK